MLYCVDLGDHFRIITNEIEVVEPTDDLPKPPDARAVCEPKSSLPISAEAWMLAGGSHHTVLTTTVSREILDDFARMLNAEHFVIDEETTPRSARKELAWSAAYYRLARRLKVS